jgi:predicted enzyme related to lactoylglutathione lyase
LKLTNRFAHRWATIETGPSYWTTDAVGAGLTIGLHPQSPKYPNPGTPGSVGFGLETYVPVEGVLARFQEQGVTTTGEIIRFEAGRVIAFEDLDGTPSYVHEFPPEMMPETDLGAAESHAGETASGLLSGGHAIVYVSSMDAAVRFYTEGLGLTLTNRYDDHLATVEAGRLVIGLHPQSPRSPVPGTKGSVMLGLTIDEPIERVVARLAGRGVRVFGDIERSEPGNFVEIEDLDGNAIYLWEVEMDSAPEEALASGRAKGE